MSASQSIFKRSALFAFWVMASIAFSPLAGALAQTPKRIALVIGNQKYTSLRELSNPVRDTAALSVLLKRHDYDVTTLHDVDRNALESALQDLEDRATGAEEAFVYFAGHGMEAFERGEHQNILAPTDAVIACENRRARNVVTLSQIFKAIEKVPKQVVVLDACRENPYRNCPNRSSGGGQGFRAALLPGEGPRSSILLGFSTAEGKLASDGAAGDNSPFAKALLSELEANPGKLFHEVLDRVSHALKDQQPWMQTTRFPNSCLAGKDCGAGGERPFVASLASGRREVKGGQFKDAVRHFTELSEQGSAEAAVELWRFYDQHQKDHGRMLDWLEKAAGMGDKRSKLYLGWAHVRSTWFDSLPTSWSRKLKKESGRQIAQELIAAGELEGYMILDEADSDIEPKVTKHIDSAAAKGYPPARLQRAKDLINPDADGKDQPIATIEKGVRDIATLARAGHAPSLQYLLDDITLKELIEKGRLKQELTDAEIVALARKLPAPDLDRRGMFETMRDTTIDLSAWEFTNIHRELTRRTLLGLGTQKDPKSALELINAGIEFSRKLRCDKGDNCDTQDKYLLKGDILEALGQPEKALPYFLGTSDESSLNDASTSSERAMRLLDRTGWRPDLAAQLAKIWEQDCNYGIQNEKHCIESAGIAIKHKDKLLLDVVHKALRDWFNPKDGQPPEASPAAASGLFVLARLGEASPGYMRQGESVEGLMRRSAVMGSEQAVAWYTQKGLTPPKATQAARPQDISLHGNWQAREQIRDGKQIGCYVITAQSGIVAGLSGAERKPYLAVSALEPGWGPGAVIYRTFVEAMKPGSVKLFAGSDEIKVEAQLDKDTIRFTGDQRALIRRLARAAHLRIEFAVTGLKGGDKTVSDIHSLEGLSAAYKAMGAKCPSLISALQ